MEDIKGNTVVLLIGALLAMIGFAVNRFLEQSLFGEVCELSLCFSAAQFLIVGMAVVVTLIFILFFV